MFGSTALEVAIGLVTTFLMFSLILTASAETVEAFLKTRARDLEKALAELLQDQKGDGLRNQFYTHPLICALYRGDYVAKDLSAEKQGTWKDAPSYIPTAQAVSALLDLRTNGKLTGPVSQALTTLATEAGENVELLRQKVGAWYDAAMERISGAYRRNMQKWLLVAGFVVAAVLNLDAVSVVRSLVTDETKRAALVVVAEGVATRNKDQAVVQTDAAPNVDETALQPDPAQGQTDTVPITSDELVKEIDRIGVPMGWGQMAWPKACADMAKDGKLGLNSRSECYTGSVLVILRHIPGWLIMALAGTLGAPFWFDLLSKLITIRSTLKPKEEPAPPPATVPAPVGQ